MSQFRIFVGSTFKDLQPYRKAVEETLHQLELGVVGMEYFGARPDAPLEVCLAEVRRCQAYIGIFGARYGSVDAKAGKSVTQLEYEEAQRLRLPSLIYLMDEEKQPVPVDDVDTVDSARLLQEFKTLLMRNHTFGKFTTPADLARQIALDVRHMAGSSGRQELRAAAAGAKATGHDWTLSLGAQPEAEGTRFRVWARNHERVEVLIYGDGAPEAHELEAEGNGYFSGH